MNDLQISPKINKGIKAIKNYADSLALIKTENDAVEAARQLVDISNLQETLETQRLEFTKPLNESLKNINKFFKQFSVPLTEADKEIRMKMVMFHTSNKDPLKPNKYGFAHFKTYTAFEIEDIGKIPLEYFMPDETKIKKALEAGIKIPGIKVIEEKRVSL